jgi:hypothetical protein
MIRAVIVVEHEGYRKWRDDSHIHQGVKGMIPRSPDHLLPDNAASLALNCDFSRNVLQR